MWIFIDFLPSGYIVVVVFFVLYSVSIHFMYKSQAQLDEKKNNYTAQIVEILL